MPESIHYLTKDYIDTLIHSHLHAMNASENWTTQVNFSETTIQHLSAFILFSFGPSIANMSMGLTEPLLADNMPRVGSMVDITFWHASGTVEFQSGLLPWPAALFMVADSLFHKMDAAGYWQDIPYQDEHLSKAVVTDQGEIDDFIRAATAPQYQKPDGKSFPPM